MNVFDYSPTTTTNSVTLDPSRSVDYKCPTCRKRYRRLAVSYSCCVLHSPGDCCHAFEQRITKKGYPKERHV